MIKKYILPRIIIIFAYVFCILTNTYAANYLYNTQKTDTITKESSISTFSIAEPSFEFKSTSQILIDVATGEVIYANNENEKLLPASVTKVMTLLLIMEQIDSGKLNYTDTITCSANASKMGGSQIWFKEGETLTVDDALKCICVVSANDVTVAMAEHIAGTEGNFVSMMNAKAKELGMENTNFVNSHGIDEENHYTTAKDISIMSRELILKHPDILKYTSIWMDSIRNGEFGLTNTNKLIRFYDGAIGLKTGSTSAAGFNLSAVAKRGDSMFIAVAMKAPTSDIRNEEVKQMLDYAFSNYETKTIKEANSDIGMIKINKNISIEAQVTNKEQVALLVNKGSNIDVQESIQYDTNLKAPILKGTVVGKIIYTNKNTGEEVGNSELVLTDDVQKSTIKDYIYSFVHKYIMNV